MATLQARMKTCPALPSSTCFLSFILTLAVVMNPTLVSTEQPSRPTYLVVYDHQDTTPPNVTSVIVAAPPGSSSRTAFGTIQVISNILRESAAPDSPVLGQIDGQVTYGRDTLYISSALVFKMPSYTGSITVEGVADLSSVSGELVITGGTGDFRLVRGYSGFRAVDLRNREDYVFEFALHIKYD